MRSLSADAVRFYNEAGYYAPVRALTTAHAAAARAALERCEAADPAMRQKFRNKTHLLFTWLDAIIRDAGVLDAVEDIIGPNILCWGSGFFIKDAHDASFVSWHQDSTYWGLDPADIVTAWVAFSESTEENGAMRVIPGSHRQEQLAHRDTFAAGNLLSRGQEVAVEVDEREAVPLVLQPGEMSLHHVRLIHGSEPNPSGKRRIGYAIRYLPTHVRQVAATHDSAMLVRGEDKFGNFEPEQRPDSDLSPAALAFHARVTGEQDAILFRGTGRSGRM